MIIIEATFRLPAGSLERARPQIAAVTNGSAAEDGCELYAVAQDLADPQLFRIAERWRDKDALRAHTQTPHFKAWRAAGKDLGLTDRVVNIYEASVASL